VATTTRSHEFRGRFATHKSKETRSKETA